MHTLVRRFLKTGIVFLVVGLAVGGWMIVRRELAAPRRGVRKSAHTHAIFVGFVMMMILGVALWMFPRPDKATPLPPAARRGVVLADHRHRVSHRR